jgi:hypothetical protein
MDLAPLHLFDAAHREQSRALLWGDSSLMR